MDQYHGQPVVRHYQTSKNYGRAGGTLAVVFYTTPSGDPTLAPTQSWILPDRDA